MSGHQGIPQQCAEIQGLNAKRLPVGLFLVGFSSNLTESKTDNLEMLDSFSFADWDLFFQG